MYFALNFKIKLGRFVHYRRWRGKFLFLFSFRFVIWAAFRWIYLWMVEWVTAIVVCTNRAKARQFFLQSALTQHKRASVQGIVWSIEFADFVFDLWRQCIGHVTKVGIVRLYILIHDRITEPDKVMNFGRILVLHPGWHISGWMLITICHRLYLYTASGAVRFVRLFGFHRFNFRILRFRIWNLHPMKI